MNAWKRSIRHFNLFLRAGIFTVCLASLSAILEITTTMNASPEKLVRHGKRSCDSVFSQEAYSTDNPFHPRNCYLKNFRSQDLVQCLGNLAAAAESIKNRKHFHIAFVGDSRVRQMYHSFSGMLPLYDANITGHIHTREIVLHQDALVTSEVLQLKVTFLWRPFVDQNLQQTIRNWVQAGVQGAPDILIIGNLIWIMNRNYQVKDYSDQLQSLAYLLDALTNMTKVIWWEQDQLDEGRYHHVGKHVALADVNNKRIREFNQAARRALQNTSVLVWDSTHTLLSEYIRACAGFPVRHDPWRHWRCYDAVHSSFLYAYIYNQRLLNFLCNPFMELGEDFCCHLKTETIFSTRRKKERH